MVHDLILQEHKRDSSHMSRWDSLQRERVFPILGIKEFQLSCLKTNMLSYLCEQMHHQRPHCDASLVHPTIVGIPSISNMHIAGSAMVVHINL